MARQMRYLAGMTALCVVSIAALAAGDEKVRVACVGDSITYGHPVVYKEPEKAYPAVLGKLLGDDYDVRNFGCNSATLARIGNVPYWNQPQLKKATEFNPNVVIITLGTNDSKVKAWMDAKQFVPDLKALIKHFRDLPAKPKIYLGVPAPVSPKRTRGITAAKVRKTITPMIREVAEEEDVPLIDFYTPLKDKLDLLPDTIHPDAEGYQIMARTAHRVLTASSVPRPPQGDTR